MLDSSSISRGVSEQAMLINKNSLLRAHLASLGTVISACALILKLILTPGIN